MAIYTMTDDETARWESDDARIHDAAEREIIAAHDDASEIQTDDGIVVWARN